MARKAQRKCCPRQCMGELAGVCACHLPHPGGELGLGTGLGSLQDLLLVPATLTLPDSLRGCGGTAELTLQEENLGLVSSWTRAGSSDCEEVGAGFLLTKGLSGTGWHEGTTRGPLALEGLYHVT